MDFINILDTVCRWSVYPTLLLFRSESTSTLYINLVERIKPERSNRHDQRFQQISRLSHVIYTSSPLDKEKELVIEVALLDHEFSKRDVAQPKPKGTMVRCCAQPG